MDSITQAALGAGISGAMLGRYHGRKAVIAGAILGTLPDLDVVIRYADPISAMIHHRGFSHSLLVLTLLSVVLTALVRRWRPSPQYGAQRLFWAIWLVLITHPLLDAFTAYGTQLLWPLRPTPTAWSTLFIIDPFFTTPLTVAVLVALIAGPGPRARRAMRWSLGWCCVYLAMSIIFKMVVESRVRETLQSDGIQVQAMFSTPQPFNILLWRVVAKGSDDHYYESTSSVLDIRAPVWLRQPLNSHLLNSIPPSRQLDGLRWFSGDWLRYDDIDGHLVVSDLRMGLGAGFYSFRFLLGRRASPRDSWTLELPQFWPVERGLSQLKTVLNRVLSATPPLPQTEWAQRMTQLPASIPSRR